MPRKKKAPAPKKARRLPTLEECEKALGEKAEKWGGRCFEVASRIVEAGLVDGVAVYGHWVGDVHPESMFARKSVRLPFVQHGWVQLADGRVLDPTRWEFEHVAPYLFVGEEPDHWSVTPCANCGLLKEEHRDGGPEDQCEMFEVEKWPYDEGGNQWRDAMMAGRPPPEPKGPRKKVKVNAIVAAWLGGVLKEPDPFHLTANQLMHVANMPYGAVKAGVGPDGLRMIYEAIADFDDTSISWLPIDNFNRARRECGLTRNY